MQVKNIEIVVYLRGVPILLTNEPTAIANGILPMFEAETLPDQLIVHGFDRWAPHSRLNYRGFVRVHVLVQMRAVAVNASWFGPLTILVNPTEP
jgi:hypothetical protein